MRALLFDKQLKITENHPYPTPPEGEALIKIILAGICNTDLEIIKGYMDFSGIPGHEFVGVVEKITGPNQGLLNKKVAGEINCACNNCEYCDNGLKTHCPNRTTLGIAGRDGCFGEYITLPVENLFTIPENVSNEEAVFVEPLAAAFQILEQISIHPTDKVLVLGDGKLGMLISLVLNTTGANVTLVGKHPQKLAIVKNQGVKTVLADDLDKSKNYDIVVEATGTAGGFEQAQELVRPRGTIVLKSTVAGGKELNLNPLVIKEVTVVGSRCGPFKSAIEALEKGLIDVKPLISKVFEFNEAIEAFEYSKKKGVMKVLIKL